MQTDPFWLSDRIVDQDANDPLEVARFGRALRQAGEDVPDVSQPTVSRAARRFQASRGMKVDCEAMVNGPTEQRLAGELFARQTTGRPAANRQLLGPRAHVPVRAPVGPGGRNLPRDRKLLLRSLAMGGYLTRFAALNPADLPPGQDDPELTRALDAFRTGQGIRERGPVTPGSETLRLLDQMVAPKLHMLIGPDVAQPRTAQPKPAARIVRNRPESATARAVPFRDEKHIAHEAAQDHALAVAQAGDIVTEMAAARRGDIVRDDQTLSGGQAEDSLAGNAAEEASKPRRLPDDPRLDDLTDRQRQRLVEIATESGFDLTDAALRARLGAYMRAHEPDFTTALEAKVASGKLDVAKLERLTGNIARQVSTHGADRTSLARLDAATDVLKQTLLKEGLDNDLAADKVTELLEKSGRGEVDVPLLLELMPGVGEIISLAETAEHIATIREARRTGNIAEANAAWTALALAAAGVVPFAGKVIRLARTGGLLKAARSTIDSQAARRDLSMMRKQFDTPFEATNVRKYIPDEVWNGFDQKTQNAFLKSISHAQGRQGEATLRDLMDRAGLHRPVTDHSLQKRYVVRLPDGTDQTRLLDEVAYGRFKSVLGGLIIRKIDGDKAFGYEVKVASARLTKQQKRADEAIMAKGRVKSNRSDRAVKLGIELPEIEDDLHHLRMPISSIPQENLVRDLTETLRDKGLKDRDIAVFTDAFDMAYEMDRQLRKAGRPDLAGKLTVGAVIGLSLGGASAAGERPAA
ncbi:MAG: hypothetical protein P1U65_02840 [Minwuia sp.]|nr:hypothetical protein [Minwuia sp.]